MIKLNKEQLEKYTGLTEEGKDCCHERLVFVPRHVYRMRGGDYRFIDNTVKCEICDLYIRNIDVINEITDVKEVVNIPHTNKKNCQHINDIWSEQWLQTKNEPTKYMCLNCGYKAMVVSEHLEEIE